MMHTTYVHTYLVIFASASDKVLIDTTKRWVNSEVSLRYALESPHQAAIVQVPQMHPLSGNVQQRQSVIAANGESHYRVVLLNTKQNVPLLIVTDWIRLCIQIAVGELIEVVAA